MKAKRKLFFKPSLFVSKDKLCSGCVNKIEDKD